VNQAQKHHLNILINEAGTQLSAADAALAKLGVANGSTEPQLGHITAVSNEFAKCDARNVAIQRYVTALPVDGGAEPGPGPGPTPGPGIWPNPPGVPFLLNDAQKAALFAAQTSVGPVSAWLAMMPPDMGDATLNLYKQFYGPGSAGWAETLYWYSHR